MNGAGKLDIPMQKSEIEPLHLTVQGWADVRLRFMWKETSGLLQ